MLDFRGFGPVFKGLSSFCEDLFGKEARGVKCLILLELAKNGSRFLSY